MDSSRLYYLYYVGSSEMRCRSGQAGERVYCAPKCRLFKLMLLNLFFARLLWLHVYAGGEGVAVHSNVGLAIVSHENARAAARLEAGAAHGHAKVHVEK